MRNYDDWNGVKKRTEHRQRTIYPKIRDVWWGRLGCNIGDEQDGKGKEYTRPILILKKFNNNIFLGLPMSSVLKQNKYYVTATLLSGEASSCIISQIRLIDCKRLGGKVGIITTDSFVQIRKAVKDMI